MVTRHEPQFRSLVLMFLKKGGGLDLDLQCCAVKTMRNSVSKEKIGSDGAGHPVTSYVYTTGYPANL